MNHFQLTPMFHMIELHLQNNSELFIKNYYEINDVEEYYNEESI